MPTFVKSAMNPNGTWQQDGMDQSEQSNRAYQAQMQGRDLQAQLALAQLGNQRYGMDQTADMARQGWDREDSRRSSEYDKAIALARIGKEPNELERRRADRDDQFDTMIMGAFGGQGAPAAGGVPAAAGVGSMDPAALRNIAIMSALRNRTAIPDFAGKDLQTESAKLELDDRKRDSARDRMKIALESGDLEGAKRLSAETGESLPVGRVEDFMAMNPAMGADLGRLTGEFVKQDSSMFGWDPGEDSIASVKAEFDRIVSVLTNRGFPPDQARQEAERIVRQNLGADANDVNAGWTQKLRSRLGMGGFEAAHEAVDPGAM